MADAESLRRRNGSLLKKKQSLEKQLAQRNEELKNLAEQLARRSEEYIEELKNRQSVVGRQEKALKKLKKVQKSLKTAQEAGNYLSWKKWVDQNIYNRAIEFRPFTSARTYPNIIRDAGKWQNFEAEVLTHIEELDNSMDRRKAGGFEILDRLDLNHDGIAFAVGHILLTMCQYDGFEDCTVKMSSDSRRYRSSRDLEGSAAMDARATTVLLGGEALLNVECKTPGCFRDSDNRDPPDLSDFRTKNSGDRKGGLSQRHLHCLNQLMRYMQNWESKYGVLTSFDVSYFIRRRGERSEWDSNLSVDISDGLRLNKESGPSLIAALHYVLSLAKDSFVRTHNADLGSSSNTSKETPEGSNDDDSITIGNQAQGLKDFDNATIQERAQEWNGDDSSTNEDQDQPQSVKRPAGDTRPASESECYEERIGNIFQEVAAEEFHLEWDPFAIGLSGNIYFGEFWGHQVVVKLAESNSSSRKALDNEAHMYTVLQDLWGKYTPKFVGHGTTSFGRVTFLATEFVYGSTLAETTITSAVATKAREALVALHSCGILHGDLHERNILVSKDGVILLDFGSSSRTHLDSMECETEMEQLELMIHNLEDFSRIVETS